MSGWLWIGSAAAIMTYAISRILNRDPPKHEEPVYDVPQISDCDKWYFDGVVFEKTTRAPRSAFGEWIWTNRAVLFDKYSLLMGAHYRYRNREGVIRGIVFADGCIYMYSYSKCGRVETRHVLCHTQPYAHYDMFENLKVSRRLIRGPVTVTVDQLDDFLSNAELNIPKPLLDLISGYAGYERAITTDAWTPLSSWIASDTKPSTDAFRASLLWLP